MGCSAFRTVQKVNQTLFFAHYTGIYSIQNYSVTLVSPQLNTTFKKDMNQGFINLMYAAYSSQEKKYYLGYPSSTSTTCDQMIVYDLLVNQYSIWDHMPGGCMVNFRFSGLTNTILMGDPNMGNIYQLYQGYADIYGDNGTATGGSSTTLADTSKSWTTNALVDARVMITGGTGAGATAVITANTATGITVGSWTGGTPGAGSTYTIGWYDSYWTSKWFDFEMIGYTKKYKFCNLFIDAEAYPIQFGFAIDFNLLDYMKNVNLLSGGLTWGQSGITWGMSGYQWGSYSSEFAQANIAGVGRYIR